MQQLSYIHVQGGFILLKESLHDICASSDLYNCNKVMPYVKRNELELDQIIVKDKLATFLILVIKDNMDISHYKLNSMN